MVQQSREGRVPQCVLKAGRLPQCVQKAGPLPQRAKSYVKEDYSQALDLILFALEFRLAWNLPPLSSLLFLPFGMGTSALCWSHHCILEAHNLFDSTGSQLEGNLPQNESYLESHPYLVLDAIYFIYLF